MPKSASPDDRAGRGRVEINAVTTDVLEQAVFDEDYPEATKGFIVIAEMAGAHNERGRLLAYQNGLVVKGRRAGHVVIMEIAGFKQTAGAAEHRRLAVFHVRVAQGQPRVVAGGTEAVPIIRAVKRTKQNWIRRRALGNQMALDGYPGAKGQLDCDTRRNRQRNVRRDGKS